MGYRMFFGEVEMPQAPERVETQTAGNNRTLFLISGEEISILQAPQLTEFRFTLTLPAFRYPWIRPDALSAVEYLSYFDTLMRSGSPFYWSFTRLLPDGSRLFCTSMQVTLERYTVIDDAEEGGFDVAVEIELRQWRDYGTQLLQEDRSMWTAERESSSSPAADTQRTYTVQEGDSLWNIAKKQLGDGSRFSEIVALNSSLIDDPDRITAGMVLILPSA